MNKACSMVHPIAASITTIGANDTLTRSEFAEEAAHSMIRTAATLNRIVEPKRE